MIRLSAYRAEDEPSRISRLAELATKLSPSLLPDIAELHDHKGHLTVTWRGPVCGRCSREVEAAWRTLNEEYVEHVTQDDRLSAGRHPNSGRHAPEPDL
jgi:hypothetical protein